MADIVISSLLRLVFDKLGAQVTKEVGLVMGVEKELNALETTLAAIRDVLADAEARQAQERALAGWLRRLKDAAFDADDVLDEVAAEALRRTARRHGSRTNAVENVKNFQQAREANLIEKDGLESLALLWDLDTYKKQMEACVRTDVEGRRRQGLINALAVAEEVLEGLQPHENLTLLVMRRYPGKTFPKWMELSLPNLVELYLSSCFKCEIIPRISQLHNLETLSLEKLPAVKSLPLLGQLPALKFLHLGYLIAVKSLGSEFYGVGDGAFPMLENLRLEHMPELEEWCEASAAQRSFPHMSELRLLDCPKLKEPPSSFPSVEQLYLCANSELLLSSLPCGAFSNLKIVHLANSYDPARPSVPRILAKRLTFVKCLDFYWWDPMDDDDLDFIRCISELP